MSAILGLPQELLAMISDLLDAHHLAALSETCFQLATNIQPHLFKNIHLVRIDEDYSYTVTSLLNTLARHPERASHIRKLSIKTAYYVHKTNLKRLNEHICREIFHISKRLGFPDNHGLIKAVENGGTAPIATFIVAMSRNLQSLSLPVSIVAHDYFYDLLEAARKPDETALRFDSLRTFDYSHIFDPYKIMYKNDWTLHAFQNIPVQVTTINAFVPRSIVELPVSGLPNLKSLSLKNCGLSDYALGQLLRLTWGLEYLSLQYSGISYIPRSRSYFFQTNEFATSLSNVKKTLKSLSYSVKFCRYLSFWVQPYFDLPPMHLSPALTMRLFSRLERLEMPFVAMYEWFGDRFELGHRLPPSLKELYITDDGAQAKDYKLDVVRALETLSTFVRAKSNFCPNLTSLNINIQHESTKDWPSKSIQLLNQSCEECGVANTWSEELDASWF